jgi:hypothetical protein
MRYDSPDFSRCSKIAQIPGGDPSTISKLLFSVSKYAMVGACVSFFLINLFKGSLVGVVPIESNTFLCEIPQLRSNYGVLWNILTTRVRQTQENTYFAGILWGADSD